MEPVTNIRTLNLENGRLGCGHQEHLKRGLWYFGFFHIYACSSLNWIRVEV